VNIFYLHEDTKECAKQHLDKHVVKMILEYAQLLSTAHRYSMGMSMKVSLFQVAKQCVGN
jgi:hypothetical protein